MLTNAKTELSKTSDFSGEYTINFTMAMENARGAKVMSYLFFPFYRVAGFCRN